jgi:hypothetical protein
MDWSPASDDESAARRRFGGKFGQFPIRRAGHQRPMLEDILVDEVFLVVRIVQADES